MATVFLKILKMNFLDKATFKIFNFFLWIVDNMDYILSKFDFW